MKTRREEQPVDLIVQMFVDGSLVRNPEYQRGEAWKLSQKVHFIDSIFREYPVPAIFLHEVLKKTFSGETRKYDIVDGQQRILTIRDYIDGKFALPVVTDRAKLKIPESLRPVAAPWLGRSYDELDESLRQRFRKSLMTVFFVETVGHLDEIRDLFIRLQSGTALTRQQIRDAWPGNMGPYVESLAGKLDRHPQKQIFRIVDKRGQGSETDTDRDPFAADRQTCAQMLTIFLARQRDAYAYPGVTANDLDGLYHEYTEFDRRSHDAELFSDVLDRTAAVFENASRAAGKRKFRRSELFAVMMLIQDLSHSPLVRLEGKFVRNVWDALRELEPSGGRATSRARIKSEYERLRKIMDYGGIIKLDPQRAFNVEQKTVIRLQFNGSCAICNKVVDVDEEEFDHFPIPYRDGGPTEVTNGRLVHKMCHPRGRPVDDEDV